MRQNFFRKVGYGLGPNELIPSDARKWAKEQLSSIPAITWEGHVPTMEDGFDEHLQHVIRRREIREKYADDPDLQDQKGRENYRIVDNAHEYITTVINKIDSVHEHAGPRGEYGTSC